MIRLYLCARIGRGECLGTPRTAGRGECDWALRTTGRGEWHHQIIHETEANGVCRITVNKQIQATMCASGQRRFAELFLIKIDKMDSTIGFALSMIVVEAIRGRCASFIILTATVSEIFGGHTNSSIFVVEMIRLYLCARIGRDECPGTHRTAGREECPGTPRTAGRGECQGTSRTAGRGAYQGTPRTAPYVNVMSLLSADTMVPSPGAAYV